MTDFQHRLISGTFDVFSSGFLHRITPIRTDSIFTCFRQLKILAQIEYFAKAIAHAKAIDFVIFNIVSFLEYGRFLLQCDTVL